jgi:hypothetical protein
VLRPKRVTASKPHFERGVNMAIAFSIIAVFLEYLRRAAF